MMMKIQRFPYLAYWELCILGKFSFLFFYERCKFVWPHTNSFHCIFSLLHVRSAPLAIWEPPLIRNYTRCQLDLDSYWLLRSLDALPKENSRKYFFFFPQKTFSEIIFYFNVFLGTSSLGSCSLNLVLLEKTTLSTRQNSFCLVHLYRLLNSNHLLDYSFEFAPPFGLFFWIQTVFWIGTIF